MLKFNVILPTINRISLQNAINSVYNQTYTNWQLYIINDAGLEEGLYIEEQDMKTFLLGCGGPHNDSGAYARNHGISLSKNNWIAYIDCDDEWLSNHLETLANMIKENPSVNMVRTAGQSFMMKHKSPRSSKLVRRVGSVNSIDILTVGMAHTREIFDKTDGWASCDNHDHKLWQDMLSAGGIAVESDIVTFNFKR